MKDLGDLFHLFACAFLFHFSAFMVIPAITDVTIEALCPGRDQCSLAIYLSGINQAVSSVRLSDDDNMHPKPCRLHLRAICMSFPPEVTVLTITGLGTLVVTPLVGNLSDKYGRKAMLTLPMTSVIVPLGTLRAEAGVGLRRALRGIRRGFRLRYRCRSFPPHRPHLSAVYMRIFLEETDGGAALMDEESTRPLCSPATDGESCPRLPTLKKKVPSLGDMFSLLKNR
ncbi:hypothetical protein B296_00002849 [Ensete ventricosum]|uniref:Major facilitator superfamily (MFS) profile domain-containing protein n=1 Tax=Ensete ventricosum TaxID=4639 RepID=A0A427BCE9_ENSVE|nr:hypothetical protein B296_00002849 [Ensete ventricosum]